MLQDLARHGAADPAFRDLVDRFDNPALRLTVAAEARKAAVLVDRFDNIYSSIIYLNVPYAE
jgi:hypothetical protein